MCGLRYSLPVSVGSCDMLDATLALAIMKLSVRLCLFERQLAAMAAADRFGSILLLALCRESRSLTSRMAGQFYVSLGKLST